MRYAVVFGIIGSMMLSACSDTPPKLRDLYDPYAGPEEFAISPNLELEMPQDLASLPTPTPGGKNLTDPNPKGDAIALLIQIPNLVPVTVHCGPMPHGSDLIPIFAKQFQKKTAGSD